LLVEAKALGESVSGGKWADKIMGYAGNLGVKWVVLTNGDEYRIYNACVDVPFPEKLFRAVRLTTDQNPRIEETLALLSKDRFDDLDHQWETFFADCRVCGALEKLFSAPNLSLVHLIKKQHVKGLTSSKQIGASLARMRDQFVRFIKGYQAIYPVEPPMSPAPVGKTKEQDAGQGAIVDGAKKPSAERYNLRRKFWTALLERAKAKTKLHGDISPSKDGWIGTGAGIGGLAYNYVVSQHGSRVELWISTAHQQKNKAIFDALAEHRRKIEDVFGGPLSWEPLEGKAKRIAKYFELGGYRDHEAKWPEIQDAMIDAMLRLESALQPFIAELKAGARKI